MWRHIAPPQREVIIICSCGDEFDPDIVPSKKVDLGSMAKDVSLSVSLMQQECKEIQKKIGQDMGCQFKFLYFDTPKLQNLKEFYIKEIKELMQGCKAAGGNIIVFSINFILYVYNSYDMVHRSF